MNEPCSNRLSLNLIFENSNSHCFSKYYDKDVYIPTLAENVYIFDGDTISSSILFTFASPHLTKEQRDDVLYNSNFEQFKQNKNAVHGVSNFIENEHFRYVCYNSLYVYSYILNKKSGKEYNGSNILGRLLPFPLHDIAFSDDKLVFFITNEAIELILSSKEEGTAEDWQIMYDNMCPTAQMLVDGKLQAPCLIYMSLK